ncbi:MAG: ABC transporter permease, partial [Verrucomicrobiia bacterium]
MNFFAELCEGFGISWDAIRANKMRSVLATLGIVIGIVTVTLMGAAIAGLNGAFLNSISALGADVFYIERNYWTTNTEADWLREQKRRPIRLPEAEALVRQLTLAAAVAPISYVDETVKYKNRSSNRVTILGTTEQYFPVSGIGISQGRALTAAESAGGRPMCVLGTQVASNLFPHEDPVGNR